MKFLKITGETHEPPDRGLSRYLTRTSIYIFFFFLVATHISDNYLGQKKSNLKILNRLAILVVAVLQKKTSTLSHFHLITFFISVFSELLLTENLALVVSINLLLVLSTLMKNVVDSVY